MVRKRLRHTAAFKFRVALEALEGSKTIARYRVNTRFMPI